MLEELKQQVYEANMLLPKYGLAQEKSAFLYKEWKEEFYEIITKKN